MLQLRSHWGTRCSCVDCGFALSETSTLWPSCAPVHREVHKSPETTEGSQGARNKQSVTLNCGSGTHIDAPSHFVAGGRTVDQLTTNELANVPVAVVDAVESAEANADYMLTVARVLEDEHKYGPIVPGSLVCVRTGWAESRYHTPEAYFNRPDPEDVDTYLNLPRMHFPGISEEAAKMLVEKRGAVGVAIDTLSPDGGSCSAGTFAAHHAILGRDRYIIENVLLTADLPARGATACIAPMYLAGAPEAPVRVWAFVPEAQGTQDAAQGGA